MRTWYLIEREKPGVIYPVAMAKQRKATTTSLLTQ